MDPQSKLRRSIYTLEVDFFFFPDEFRVKLCHPDSLKIEIFLGGYLFRKNIHAQFNLIFDMVLLCSSGLRRTGEL